MCKFCRKARFPHSFFRKISTPRYFSQWLIFVKISFKVFSILLKILTFNISKNSLKQKFLEFLTFHCKYHIWQNVFFFLSYGLKCCQPIRLHDYWKFNISRMTWARKLILECNWVSIEATSWSRHLEWVWWGMSGHAQSSIKWWVSNISRMSWGMKLIF